LRSTPSIVSETQSPSELQPPVSKPREALSPNRQILLAVAVGLVILFTGTIFYMSLARGTNHTDAMTANQAVANTVSSGLAPDAATAATDSSTHHANTTRGANSAATVADPRPKSSAAIPANPTARRLARPDSVTNAPSADGTSEIAAVRDSAEPSHADTPMPSARSGTFGLPWRSGRLVNVSSGVMAANLVAAPMPAYPKLASLTRMQGNVIMQAIISKKGTVESVRVLKGHRLLRSAAISAVRGWRYRPYLVSGRPVEVATIVSVDFSLQH
jgi:TonB family protein